MELMDTSLDKFYRKVLDKNMTIPEDILGEIAVSVSGLGGVWNSRYIARCTSPAPAGTKPRLMVVFWRELGPTMDPNMGYCPPGAQSWTRAFLLDQDFGAWGSGRHSDWQLLVLWAFICNFQTS